MFQGFIFVKYEPIYERHIQRGNLRILILVLNFFLKVLQWSNWEKGNAIISANVRYWSNKSSMEILLTILYPFRRLSLWTSSLLLAWFSSLHVFFRKLRGFRPLNIFFVSRD